MRRLLPILVSLVLLAGCGGGGSRGPAPFTEPFGRQVSEQQKCYDIVEGAARNRVSYMDIIPEVGPYDLEGIGGQLEEAINNWGDRRLPAGAEIRASASQGTAESFVSRPRATRSPTRIDETTADGWHWTGTYETADTSTDWHVKGVKPGVGTIEFETRCNGDATKYSVTIQTGTDILTKCGKVSSCRSIHKAQVDGASISFTHEKYAGFDGEMLQTVGVVGVGDKYSGVYVNGTSSRGYEDGYWMTVTYDSTKLEINSYLGWGYVRGGSLRFLASDGFSGTLTIGNQTWSGEVHNAESAKVADIADNGDGTWSVIYGNEDPYIVPYEQLEVEG